MDVRSMIQRRASLMQKILLIWSVGGGDSYRSSVKDG